jgi:hypothetical protein
MKLDSLRNRLRPHPPIDVTITPVARQNLGKLDPYLRPLGVLPPLITFMGCGFGMRGSFRDGDLSPFYFAIWWITAFQFPLIPLRIYLLTPMIDAATGKAKNDHRLPGGWGIEFRVYGSMSLRDFHKIYGSGLLKLLLNSYVSFLWLVVVLFGVLLVLTFIFLAIGLLADHFKTS